MNENKNVDNVGNMRFGCKIIKHQAEYMTPVHEVIYYRTGYSFNTYNRFKWYFRYRCAKFQVENPRNYIEFVQFSYPYVPTEEILQKRIKDKISARKGKLTELRNKLAKAKQDWKSIFPIEEDEIYKNSLRKIEEYERDLLEFIAANTPSV